ncbi:MAG TPA: T9SS type A sorting domain-containing protein [Bacteroidales bacterium]|nr:T9SS type A sorting domain-containing protein [Bacteroidales bacterium]
MKQYLLALLFFLSCYAAYAQRDSITASQQVRKGYSLLQEETNVSIYPVPVRENFFTIKSDKEITSVRITNIIGQEIFMEKFNLPVTNYRIVLENPTRGMYLIAITFSDNTRIVRRLLVEPSV